MKNKPKVAIIGAGLAGLTAALRLHQKGYDINVYEACKRVGGRVFTVIIAHSGDEYFLAEMGGQNIADGGATLYMVSLAKELGLAIEEKIIERSLVVHSNGEYQDINRLICRYALPAINNNQVIGRVVETCKSMYQLLDMLFVNNELLKNALVTRLTAYEGLDIRKQSVYHNVDTLKRILIGGLPCVGQQSNDEVIYQVLVKTIQSGNAQLPLKIAEILEDKIHLGKALISVSQEESRIRLLFHDNSIAYCDKLILSIPASVYADIKFDENIIPSSQLKQITSIEYGANSKIVVPIKTSRPIYRSVMTDKQICSFPNGENVMVMYFIDDFFSLDHEIEIIKKAYPNVEIALNEPIKAIDKQFTQYNGPVTYSWLSSPYSKGSYSGYNVLLSELLDQQVVHNGVAVKKIFQPVDDRIFFIGEHTTILDAIGTMEAAVESAERIASLFN